jgi:hypothetical protein
MTRNTALSLVALVAIGLYFLAQVRPGGTPRPSIPEVQSGEMAPGTQTAAPEEQGAPHVVPDLCRARITWITRAGAEISFAFEGEAENVYARWPSGEYKARVADTCTGTECRFTLPRPGMADVRIALDSCPPEPAP